MMIANFTISLWLIAGPERERAAREKPGDTIHALPEWLGATSTGIEGPRLNRIDSGLRTRPIATRYQILKRGPIGRTLLKTADAGTIAIGTEKPKGCRASRTL